MHFALCIMNYFVPLQVRKDKENMSQEELRSYRLNSMEEPTDEMLEAIMQGVRESARRSTANARAELARRFEEMKREIVRRRKANAEHHG